MEIESKSKDHSANECNEDYITKNIGAFGLWQAKVCVIAILTRFLAMWNMLNIMFLTYDNKFICVKFNGSHPVNVTPSTCYEDCLEYEINGGLFEKGFVSEFGLVCEKAWMASYVQTILMFGMLFGVSLCGWISDRFGRSRAIKYSAFVVVVLMVGSSFAQNYWSFCVLRFLTGVATGGQLVVGVVVVVQVVGAQHREIAGRCVTLPDGVAEAALAAFAYFSPTWRIYLLSISTVSALIVVFQLFLPEIPRWLDTRGHLEKAKRVMTKAAKCNNLNADKIEDNINSIVIPQEQKTTYCDLFRSRRLSIRTLCSVIIWTVGGMCFFGINQYCSFLGTNVFLSVIIMGLIQVPTCFVASWLNKSFGRKASIISNFTITGVMMLVLVFTPPHHWTALMLGIIGLFAINIIFKVLNVFIAELFPTPLRNMGFAACSSGAKIGAMISPFVTNLAPHWVPSLIFTVIAFMGACFYRRLKGRSWKMRSIIKTKFYVRVTCSKRI